MSFSLVCPACTRSFRTATDPCGKKCACPKCGQRVVVTSAGVAKCDEPRPATAPVPAPAPWDGIAESKPARRAAAAPVGLPRPWVMPVALLAAALLLLSIGIAWFLLAGGE